MLKARVTVVMLTATVVVDVVSGVVGVRVRVALRNRAGVWVGSIFAVMVDVGRALSSRTLWLRLCSRGLY